MQPSSTNAPVRRRKLLTMDTVKQTRQKLSQKERESKQVIKCLRRRLAWCNRTKLPYDSSQEQYSVLPRALADQDGVPHKSSKSIWTDKLESRYKSADPSVVTPHLPEGWTPQVAILDAMFLINTRPLRRTKTIAEYAKLLFDRFVLEHFQAGITEVHLLFDKPTKHEFNPKEIEHTRRDTAKSKSTCKQHEHISFCPETPTPQVWREYIECRECKRSIVEAIGLSLLQKGRLLLQQSQSLIIAGCFSGNGEDSAWIIHPNHVSAIAEPLSGYECNAAEADTRIWRHATQTWATNILIYSPDTDVHNIGLGLVSLTSKEYVIQLNVPHAEEKRYLHLTHLLQALQKDPDLASLPRNKLGLILQSLFISTGCDFISYFKTIGKASFLNIFFQHAEFICGPQVPGCLDDTANPSNGFLSFVRLVGTCYFKKHIAAFITLFSCETPVQLFNSLESSTEKHQIWLQKIRDTVSDRIVNEEERVPSYTALWRHWLRSCWVSRMWQNATLPNLFHSLPRPDDCGWIEKDGKFSIDWEAPEVLEKVKTTIDFLIKGCSCKKGCKSKICGCRKKDTYCGPGCECQGCTNLPVQCNDDDDDVSTDDELSSELEVDDSSSSDDDCLEAEAEVITDEFPFIVEDIM